MSQNGEIKYSTKTNKVLIGFKKGYTWVPADPALMLSPSQRSSLEVHS